MKALVQTTSKFSLNSKISFSLWENLFFVKSFWYKPLTTNFLWSIFTEIEKNNQKSICFFLFQAIFLKLLENVRYIIRIKLYVWIFFVSLSLYQCFFLITFDRIFKYIKEHFLKVLRIYLKKPRRRCRRR